MQLRYLLDAFWKQVPVLWRLHFEPVFKEGPRNLLLNVGIVYAERLVFQLCACCVDTKSGADRHGCLDTTRAVLVCCEVS